MKTIVVTGFTGFVGTNLTPYLLKEGFDIIGAGRRRTTGTQAFEQVSYPELAVINKYDALVHLAGKAHDLRKTSNDAEYFEVNTDLTIRIFEDFIRSNAKVFIYVSSVKAAADTVDGILTETAIATPLTVYGQSKLKAEEYLLRQTLPEGKKVYILRPCMIHGPGNKGNLNLLYQLIKKGLPYPLAAFKNKRSLLSIKNLLFVIKALIDNENINSGIYNVADDEPLATTDMINILAKGINKKPVKWAISPGLIKGVAAIGDALPLPLNTEKLKKLTESYVVSNNKIKKAIGIKHFPVSAEDGLLYTALNL
jgi:nucleoside-diphosphate-sugar epimerase